MVAIFFGAFMSTLAMSMINVAIPNLMSHFQTDLDSVQWTLTGFMLATGIIAPVTGYLGDRFTFKRLYVFALIGFTIASFLCSIAWSIESLVAFRILQGLFNGIIMPTTMTIIYQIVTREKQAFAISLWSVSAMLAPAIGPTLSGWLIQYMSWKWLFLINLPVGLISIILAIRMIPSYRLRTPKGFDVPGLVTVVASSLSLLIAFSEGHKWGWSSWQTLSLIIFGVVTLALFIWRELAVAEPLLNIRVFQNKRYTFAIIVNCIMTMSLYSGVYLTPLFLQSIQHTTPVDVGLILLPASAAMALITPVVGKLYARVGPFLLSVLGVVFIAVGTWAMSRLTVDVSHTYVVLWMMVRNIGIALAMTPVTNAGMEELAREQYGHASSVNNWVRQVIGSFSIGLFTSMFAARSTTHATDLAVSGTVSKAEILPHAFTMSINDVFLLATIVVVIALPFAFTLRNRSKQPASHQTGQQVTAKS
ncbi:MAG: DHA2 family efflux MFS transporter permease subunit [Tumebacillaceae bacterium]